MILTNCNRTYYYFKAEFTLIDPVNKKASGVRFKDVAGLKEPKIEVRMSLYSKKNTFIHIVGKGLLIRILLKNNNNKNRN